MATVEPLGGQVYFVALRLSAAEQERRIENADRRRFRKLTSLDTLRHIRATPGPVASALPVDLDIDTEASTPQQTAQRIIDAFGLPADQHARGYRIK